MLHVKHDDVVLVKDARSFRRQSVTTLSACLTARRSEHRIDPAYYEQQKERNGTAGAVWLSAQCVVIAADPSSVDRSFVAEVAEGERIYVESDFPGEAGEYIVTRPGLLGGDSWRLTPA